MGIRDFKSEQQFPQQVFEPEHCIYKEAVTGDRLEVGSFRKEKLKRRPRPTCFTGSKHFPESHLWLGWERGDSHLIIYAVLSLGMKTMP